MDRKELMKTLQSCKEQHNGLCEGCPLAGEPLCFTTMIELTQDYIAFLESKVDKNECDKWCE